MIVALWVKYLIAIIALGAIVMLVTRVADLPPKWSAAIQIVAGAFALILAILMLSQFVGMG